MDNIGTKGTPSNWVNNREGASVDNFPFVWGEVVQQNLDKSLILVDKVNGLSGKKDKVLVEFCFEGFGNDNVLNAIKKLNSSEGWASLSEEDRELLHKTLVNSLRRVKSWKVD